MGRLLLEWTHVFDAEVLPRLDPTTRALTGRVGQACRDAVLRSPDLPCAGRTVGVKFGVEDFVGSNKLLAWAKDNGCRWDAPTCAVVAKGGRLEVLQWAREHDCPWDEGTCEAAFHGGHQEVLQWAREHGCPWDSNVLRAWREECPELRELWDLSEPVTAWEGVTFGEAGGADAGRVVMIGVFYEGLTGELPAAFGELIALKRLFLGGNQLESVPAALGGLTALTWLNLSNNQLTSMPAELGALTALKRLNLNGNQLTSVPAAWEEGGALEQSGCRIFR